MQLQNSKIVSVLLRELQNREHPHFCGVVMVEVDTPSTLEKRVPVRVPVLGTAPKVGWLSTTKINEVHYRYHNSTYILSILGYTHFTRSLFRSIIIIINIIIIRIINLSFASRQSPGRDKTHHKRYQEKNQPLLTLIFYGKYREAV